MSKSKNKYYLEKRLKILSKLKCKLCGKRVSRYYLKKHQKTLICQKKYCEKNNILFYDKKKKIYLLKGRKVENPFILYFD